MHEFMKCSSALYNLFKIIW